jgi:phage terminase large subunit-like protein
MRLRGSRASPLIQALIADPAAAVTRDSIYENGANLTPGFLDQIIRKYEGASLGRQEIEAELLGVCRMPLDSRHHRDDASA